MVDGSESIFPADFALLQNGLVQFVSRLLADPSDIAIALGEFSTTAVSFSDSFEKSTASIAQLTQSKGVTNTGTALGEVLSFFQSNTRSTTVRRSFGRSETIQATKLAIILTDGAVSPSNAGALTANLAELSRQNIQTVAVGLGSRSIMSTLETLAQGRQDRVLDQVHPTCLTMTDP